MTLQALNQLDQEALRAALGRCNGSTAWIEGMAALFPVSDKERLLQAATEVWQACGSGDWIEAFRHHPRIGDLSALREKFAATGDWAKGEQAGAGKASDEVLRSLAECNDLYESKFGFIYIVCATGRSAAEMLADLMMRLNNDPAQELRIAMGEQNKITLLRLEKLLS